MPLVNVNFLCLTVKSVGTQYSFENSNMELLPIPPSMVPESSLIGLTLPVEVAVDENEINTPLVRISFQHLCVSEIIRCVAWSIKDQEWQTNGCHLNSDLSSPLETICDCYHLTNFGILFDYMNNADPYDPFLSVFTNVTLSISVFFIALTEIVLWTQQKEIRYQKHSLVYIAPLSGAHIIGRGQ